MEACNRACESEPMVWPFKRNLFRFVLFNGAICSVSAFYKRKFEIFLQCFISSFLRSQRGQSANEGSFNSRGLSAQTGSTLQLLVAKPFKENVSFLRHRLKSLKELRHVFTGHAAPLSRATVAKATPTFLNSACSSCFVCAFPYRLDIYGIALFFNFPKLLERIWKTVTFASKQIATFNIKRRN